MSDKFVPIALKRLLSIILLELDTKKSVFGIPDELFFVPSNPNPFETSQFNQKLSTPIGVAAGPHSQMAQNIVVAWLMGARYIELKTIQTLDELDIAKPCIDIQDEGYNCEWSQELKIQESFHEYLNAWIIIHVLHHKLGMKGPLETIFNMSVGYNLDGIMKPNVQWFFEKMSNCTIELQEKIDEISGIYPEIKSLLIPSKISDNITLSTMHGCPSYEIEEIVAYLLVEKKLHTYVKLNPTLLGSENLRDILNNQLNFKTIVPDLAFEHDLKYTDALKLIRSLEHIAKGQNLEFGLKLTNTLESINHKTIFDSEVEMMYMSGRALHPISINLAHKLQEDFKGSIPFSFSAGIDAFNVSDTLAAGFNTITICTDLLKSGGYMRLHQYFKELTQNFLTTHSNNINEFITHTASATDSNITVAKRENLKNYAAKVLKSKRYKREYIITPDIKTKRELHDFDCIAAPCQDACATHQDIPNYLYHTAQGDFEKAYQVILETNPFPSITGMVCDHLCQNKCTRVHYDDTILIREVKRFISEQTEVRLHPSPNNALKVAVIGGGPSGMACAYYLALAGFGVEIFEANSKTGGMVQYAIPGFRLTDEAIERDFKRVTDLGVTIHYNYKIVQDNFQTLQKDFNYIFLGTGAQLSIPLDINGNNTKGVFDPLKFLFQVRKGELHHIGNHVIIIGGGNTAMDAARTAYRMVGNEGSVTIVYRRTINEMPADVDEIKAVMEEGVKILELTAPERIISENGKVKALICSKMHLSGLDHSGRPKPVKIPESEIEIPCDTIIPALGQKIDINFISNDLLQSNTSNYQTKLNQVFIGGDALRGASSAINAIGDGRKAAEQIIQQSSIDYAISKMENEKDLSKKELILKRAIRIPSAKIIESPLNDRKNFNLINETLDKETIITEADRCLYCDEICNICTSVCPNFANFSYDIDPVKYQLQKAIVTKGNIEIVLDKVFEVKQKYQILNITNFCNECGNCDTFCPTSSAPYKSKPQLHLDTVSFEQATNGYFLTKNNSINTLFFKENEHNYSLEEHPEKYVFESENIMAELDRVDFRILKINLKNKEQSEYNFQVAAQMSVIIKGAALLY